MPTATPSEPGHPPSVPRNLRLTPGDGKIEVEWEEPEDLGDPAIDGYSVGFRKVGANGWGHAGHDGTSASLEGLENGVEYEVRVIASNIHGRAIAGPMQATPAGADSGGGQGDEQEGEEESEPPDKPALTPTATSVPPTATPTPTLSEPGRLPSAPRDLTWAQRAGRIYISWSAPADEGDPPFTGYEFHVRVKRDAGWSETMKLMMGRRITSQWRTPQTGDLEFEIQVRAFNKAGAGPFAGPVHVTVPGPPTATPTPTPVPPTATPVPPTATPVPPTATQSESGHSPSAPRNLRLTPGDGKIEVSWDEPEDLGDPELEGYSVGFRKAGANNWTYVERTSTSASLEGLENGVEYDVWVVASNRHGRAIAGPMRATPNPPTATPVPPTATPTDHPVITVEEAPTATPVPPTATATSTPAPTATPSGPGHSPSAPRNLRLTPGDGKIEVSWDEPEDLGKPAIDYYDVEYRKVGTNEWRYVRSTSTSATLDGLENGVEYEVEVIVSNIHGWAIAGPMQATPNPPTATPTDHPGIIVEEAPTATPVDTATPVPPAATATPTDHPVAIVEEAPTATPVDTATPVPPAATPSGPDRPPSAPRNLRLTPGDGKIEVSWDEPEDLGKPELEGYDVGFRKAGANGWRYVGSTSTSASLEGLENGVEYDVWVVASNRHGRAIAGPMRATPNPPTATPVPPTATATPTDHPVITGGGCPCPRLSTQLRLYRLLPHLHLQINPS